MPIEGAPRSYGMDERKVADVLRWENICNATLPNENRREVYPTWRGNDEWSDRLSSFSISTALASGSAAFSTSSTAMPVSSASSFTVPLIVFYFA